jgi:hypothetical protein
MQREKLKLCVHPKKLTFLLRRRGVLGIFLLNRLILLEITLSLLNLFERRYLVSCLLY